MRVVGRALLALLVVAGSVAGAPDAEAPATDLVRDLGVIRELRAQGSLEEAIALADQLVKGHPDALEAHVTYQDLHLARGEGKRLRPEYVGPATSSDATADDLYLYARLLDGRRAVSYLRRALKADPEHFEALCALGAHYVEQGRGRKAREYLLKAVDVDPRSPIPVNTLGWLSEAEGDAEHAETYYRKAVSLDKTATMPLINLGIFLVGRHRLLEAERILTQAKGLAPADPMPLLGLGMVRAAEGMRERAMALYEKALTLPNNTIATYKLLGSSYVGLEEFGLAEAAFAKVLRKQPDDLPTLLTLGYLHLQLGESGKAIERVDAALRIDNRSPEAHFLKGLCLEYSDKKKPAERSYRRAAELDRECSDYPRALGALYLQQTRYREAVKCYETAAKLDGRAIESLLDLAFAYIGAGAPKKALEVFAEVVDREPGNLTAWMNLGLLHQEKLNDPDAAIAAYEEYIDRGGTDPRVKNWLDDLRR